MQKTYNYNKPTFTIINNENYENYWYAIYNKQNIGNDKNIEDYIFNPDPNLDPDKNPNNFVTLWEEHNSVDAGSHNITIISYFVSNSDFDNILINIEEGLSQFDQQLVEQPPANDYIPLDDFDCNNYDTENLCNDDNNNRCEWVEDNNICEYQCNYYNTQDNCDISRCEWVYDNDNNNNYICQSILPYNAQAPEPTPSNAPAQAPAPTQLPIPAPPAQVTVPVPAPAPTQVPIPAPPAQVTVPAPVPAQIPVHAPSNALIPLPSNAPAPSNAFAPAQAPEPTPAQIPVPAAPAPSNAPVNAPVPNSIDYIIDTFYNVEPEPFDNLYMYDFNW